jgi:hypothetical protein
MDEFNYIKIFLNHFPCDRIQIKLIHALIMNKDKI